MMKVAYSKAAVKALKRMPSNERRRIVARIEAYAAEPKGKGHDVIKMHGREGYVGNWRVIFDQDGAVMDILAIGPRDQIYDR